MQSSSLGILGAAAATPLGQRQGEVDRTRHEAAAQARQAASEKAAESASGIGETDGNEPTSERDADGRRLWESDGEGQSPSGEPFDPPPHGGSSRDATGQCGGQLDLSG